MKKLCLEEKTDLKQELKTVKIFLLFFFFIIPLEAQIPINGFCKYNNYDINHDHKRIFTLNFNNDAYTDVLLFGGNTKNVASYSGEIREGFNFSRKTNLQFDVSNIQPIRNRNKSISGYAYLSRNARKAGIAQIAANGLFSVTSEIHFSSFPDNISVADVNKNGTGEVLVFGSAFEGLSLLTHSGNKLLEEKIAGSNPFSQSVFIDITNNGSPDIAAFDILNNKLFFYYNNGSGKFREARSIKLTNAINSLLTFDVNLDSYQDLIYADGESITIMYGDSASSYRNKNIIKTKYKPNKVIVSDFNRDGIIDIAYIDTETSLLSVIYAKDETTFYKEIIYIYKEGIIDVVPYYSRFINGILVLHKEGLQSITHVTSISDGLKISLGKNPSSISFFDYSNNGINDLVYVDSLSGSINFIIRDNAGIPKTFFAIPFFQYNTKVIVDDFDAFTKTFYFYSLNQRSVEIITVSFSDFKVNREILYSPGGIIDLKILREPGESRSRIYAVYLKKKNLGMTIFSFKDFRYIAAQFPNLSDNAVDAKISLLNELSLFYWKYSDNKVQLSEIKFEKKSNPKHSVELYNASVDKDFNIVSYANDLLGSDNDFILSFIFQENKKNVILTGSDFNYILNIKGLPEKGNINSSNFYFDEKTNSVNNLYLYIPDNKMIMQLIFLRGGREIIGSKKINAENLNCYIVGSLSYRKNHIVYTDKKNRLIVIKEL